MNLTISEQLIFSVVQINMLNENNILIGTASGFIGSFGDSKERNSYVPAIVTNRHVLSACSRIAVTFTRATESEEPDVGHTVSVQISTSSAIFHPNDKIDLAILPFGQALNQLNENGTPPFFRRLQLELIPSAEEWSQLDALEEVIMAGYPKGLRDPINNLPILRRGITATHPSYNFNGAPEFLVDMPCFEGCSGSPVFILQQGTVVDPRTQSINFGQNRVFLLGIQRAIPNIKSRGKLEFVPLDTQSVEAQPVMQMYLNLGFIIKSTELLAFDDIIRAQYGI